MNGGMVVSAVLGVGALLFFVAERSLSLFSWSRLEELSITRTRRHAVEKCLEERELVSACFLVFGGTALAAFVGLAGIAIMPGVESWRVVLRMVVLAVLTTWLGPELAAWRFGDRVTVWIVPPLYRALGAPFRGVRGLIVQPSPQENGEKLPREREPGTEAAVADAEAHELFRMAVKSQHTPVREIMTPRTEMVGVPDTASLQHVAELSQETGYSRFPVYRGNRDRIIGILHVKDLLIAAGNEQWEEMKPADLARRPFFIPETKTISDLMEEFQRSKTHIGIVLDEYGGTSGLVTLEDIVEELVGEIYDEYEKDEPEEPLFVWIDDRRAEVQAVIRVEEFNEEFELDLPGEEDFDTLGGFVTYVLGKIPPVGESFHFGNALFTILEADPRHVIRVRVELEHSPKSREKA